MRALRVEHIKIGRYSNYDLLVGTQKTDLRYAPYPEIIMKENDKSCYQNNFVVVHSSAKKKKTVKKRLVPLVSHCRLSQRAALQAVLMVHEKNNPLS